MKLLHLLGDSGSRLLIIDALASREKNVLDRCLDRSLVYRCVAYLTYECGILEELSVNAEEDLACRELTKGGCSALEIDYR